MGLINNPAFLDRDLGSTNGLFVRFGVATPKITAITCIGEITVSSIVAGEVVETTYTDLESAQLDIQADANTTVRIVGDVTALVLNEERATFLDLRALRSLRSLTLHQNTATFTLNLAGCRKLQTLDLSDCWLLRSLDLSQNTQLESLNLAGCRDLQSLDLSANKFLLYVDLTDCRSIPYLDVTMLTNLEELKIDGTQLQSPGNNLIITKALGGTNTEKHLLQFENAGQIKEDGKVLTHAEIYDMLMNTPDFVVLVYADHAFHPNLVTPSQIAFTCSYLGVDGQISTERVNITSANVVTYTPSKGVARQTNGGLYEKSEVVSDATQEKQLLAGVVYEFPNRTSDLTLTLAPSLISGYKGEYHMFIVVTGTPTITWPSGMTWANDDTPTIKSGKTYEVSILNNSAAYLTYENV